ncbi:MAG TPA: protein translocase subunit SecF, partial [Bryobacteraceae bacterium]|nr:protein translocase subunit SecF [Bryobacteraceae bacterium]
MELFKQTNIDFLGIKWPFIIGSLLLLAVGLGSLAVKGGPRYGIDFKGGAMVYVKFADEPPVDKVRAALAPKLGGTPDIQALRDSNELIIGTELASEQELERARTTIIETLAATFGGTQQGKFDINSVSRAGLVDQLRTPLAAAGVNLSEEEMAKTSEAILNFRDTPPRSGVLRSVDQLNGLAGVNPQVVPVLKQQAYAAPYAVRQTETVGPKMGAELRQQAILATLYALGGMLIYIALRFEWVSGVASVVAVLHDTLITIGLLSLFD